MAAILLCAVVVSCAPSRQQVPVTLSKDQAMQLVRSFEEHMRHGLGVSALSDLLPLFAPDGSDTDRSQRAALLTALPADKYRQFTLTSYVLSDAQCDNQGCQVAVSETRDYGATSARFGRQFDRVFVLRQYDDAWRVKEYGHVFSGNTFFGSLSGSVKYSGFYP